MSVDLPARLAALDAWLAENVPAISSTLQSGASEAELDILEQHIVYQLPQDFRTLYTWHDGQKHPPGQYVGGAIVLAFIPLEDVRREWDVWKELEEDFQNTEGHTSHPADRIQEQYINPGWVAFLVDGGGNSVGVDLNPGPAGIPGQVITFGRDENEKYMLAESLAAFLDEFVRRLEAGRVAVLHPNESGFQLALLSASEKQMGEYMVLADLFPGFGASPTP